ncbi:unnamed protein product [Plutella xylostella]|uniref:(diamondback moth) hypothetical protein n=1 Tax=Plutella xylostella TaxID=51655 RepID=A0A8S4DAF6_PLUXY|nr:unnamed protein product [Plutella xylostella]
MLWRLAVLAALACAQGRVVNISNTWVLPEEGFPVFYRHFRDRISWYEADAVCQFHHANLVTAGELTARVLCSCFNDNSLFMAVLPDAERK